MFENDLFRKMTQFNRELKLDSSLDISLWIVVLDLVPEIYIVDTLDEVFDFYD